MEINSLQQSILLDEFLERKKKNRAYSLRAFARFLGLSPSYVSLIFAGKRKLPRKTAIKLSDRLNLSPSLTKKMISEADGSDTEFIEKEEIQEDLFKMIADWRHFAVLSLGDIKNNKAQPKWIAQRLGISEIEARDVFYRLLDLEMIQIIGESFKQKPEYFQTKNDIPSAAIRRFHVNLIDHIKENIEVIPVEEREIQATVFAGSAKKLKRVKELVRQFQQEIEKELGSDSPDTVFSISTQLMPLSKKVK